MTMQDPSWPKTLEEAADLFLNNITDDEKKQLQDTKRESLIHLHFSLGTTIRNKLDLWRGNEALLKSSGCDHPDDCSIKIIERVWEKLQEDITED